MFWEFCTSLVVRSVVQDSHKHRRILGRCYNKCLWGKARMGSAYHFNLLMYFLVSHRHTTLTCHIFFLGLPTILPKMKVVAIVYLFAKLAPLCLPSVSLTRPLSPLLSPCSCLQLLLGLVSSSAPPLKALEFNCSEKNAGACGYQRVCQET